MRSYEEQTHNIIDFRKLNMGSKLFSGAQREIELRWPIARSS